MATRQILWLIDFVTLTIEPHDCDHREDEPPEKWFVPSLHELRTLGVELFPELYDAAKALSAHVELEVERLQHVASLLYHDMESEATLFEVIFRTVCEKGPEGLHAMLWTEPIVRLRRYAELHSLQLQNLDGTDLSDEDLRFSIHANICSQYFSGFYQIPGAAWVEQCRKVVQDAELKYRAARNQK